MYGLGRAEGELGRFAQRRRADLVIATKFGIAATPAGRLLGVVQAPLQRARLRERTVGETAEPRDAFAGRLLYGPSSYDARTAERSLVRSLRQLRTDHVDILMLHDPRPGDVRSDDVRGYLEAAQSKGLIRAWGVAGEPRGVSDGVERLGAVPVVQIRHDALDPPLERWPRTGVTAAIVFGVLSRALPRILAHIDAASAQERWSETLGAPASEPETIAMFLLRDAITVAGGPVLFSTTHTDRLAVAARAASLSDDSTLEAFRSLLSEIREDSS